MSSEDLTKKDATKWLRRQFLEALTNEKSDVAIRAYTATLEECDAWQQDERRRQEEKVKSKRGSTRNLLRRTASSRSSRHLIPPPVDRKDRLCCQPGDSSDSSVSSSVDISSSTLLTPAAASAKRGLLASAMHPTTALTLRVPDNNEKVDTKILVEMKKLENGINRIKARRIRKPIGHRLPGFFFNKRSDDQDENDETSDANTALRDRWMTTPLHQAARMGCGELVQLMLANGGNPNDRDGRHRTVLHMAAGGMVEAERATKRASTKRPVDPSIGIRSPIHEQHSDMEKEDVNPNFANGERNESGGNPVGRFFKRALSSKGDDLMKSENKKKNETGAGNTRTKITLHSISVERMECMDALMSWSNSEEGVSINSVDTRGRTALHYASELGRSEVCSALLTSIGTMLTIVDETGRTPCELASEKSHKRLASQLEARALIFTDPYGMDDEMMAALMADQYDWKSDQTSSKKKRRANARKALATPFSWFDTWTMDMVDEERVRIVRFFLSKMNAILIQDKKDREMNELLFSHVNDSDQKKELAGGHGEVTSTLMKDVDGSKIPPEEETTKEETTKEKQEDGDRGHIKKDGSGIEEVGGGSQDENCNEKQENQTAFQRSHVIPEMKFLHESQAERFLAFFSWDIAVATKAFEVSPHKALEEAGISEDLDGTTKSRERAKSTTVCQICFEAFQSDSTDFAFLDNCVHGFCKLCLGEYLAASARTSGLIHTCPHHECSSLLSQNEVKRLAPNKEVYESMRRADNESFVSCSRDLRFCPHPGCAGVVQRIIPQHVVAAEYAPECMDSAGAVCTLVGSGNSGSLAPYTYEGVKDPFYLDIRKMKQPAKAHRFCFSCGDAVHWPTSCETIEKWKDKVRDEIGDVVEGGEGGGNFEEVAHKLWLKTNTRPCPRCKVAIEKNDGCNHMTCTNRHCRHEFCWVCRKDWKLHNTDTGGFFRCNRWQEDEDHQGYDVPQLPPTTDPNLEETPDDQTYGTAAHAARISRKNARSMARFIHHYQRWTAHKESAILERKMADSVCTRIGSVVRDAKEFSCNEGFDFGGRGLSFIHAAFTELLECRSFLQHSYAFAFYRYPKSYDERPRFRAPSGREIEKNAFEKLQAEVEMLTEQMSDIVARSHLRATQAQIMFLTSGAAEKRGELDNFAISIIQREIKKKRKQAEKEKPEQKGNGNDQCLVPNRDIGSTPSSVRARETLGWLQTLIAGDEVGVSPNLSEMIQRLRDMSVPVDALYGDQDNMDVDDVSSEEDAPRATRPHPTSYSEEVRRALEQSMFGAVSDEDEDFEDFDEAGDRWADWACVVCTYHNSGGVRCAMCGTGRAVPERLHTPASQI